MKKNIKLLILLLFVGVSTTSIAQHNKMREKIKSLKVAFVTEKLNLSSSEAEIFWPIYNEYEKKMNLLRESKFKNIYSKMKDLDNLSDKEVDRLLDLYLEIEEKEEELDKVFYKKLSKTVSAKKAFILIKTEKDFQRRLIDEYRKKKDKH